jgi:hypothetical protein
LLYLSPPLGLGLQICIVFGTPIHLRVSQLIIVHRPANLPSNCLGALNFSFPSKVWKGLERFISPL